MPFYFYFLNCGWCCIQMQCTGIALSGQSLCVLREGRGPAFQPCSGMFRSCSLIEGKTLITNETKDFGNPGFKKENGHKS
ncbi:hypothetical protein AAFF_G00343900 [Aldrovandia affinis]|uniref:Uncharacterized protein n=1 Tax=Aldrovandia affinis TaxID=143900 RepID=A0AAD7WPA7_9TELE|nr:hypothetical protein AAFF_G00343900 [Aldrovandia affinis]